MKSKRLIISLLLIILIISGTTQCFAKYVYEYNILAAEIRISN